jgi:hypothetical protein
MNSKGILLKPQKPQKPQPVILPQIFKIDPKDVNFIGEYGKEKIILKLDEPFNATEGQTAFLTYYTYIPQFFIMEKVEEFDSIITITLILPDKALVDPVFYRKIKGAFFYLSETAQNISSKPDQLMFELETHRTGDLERLRQQIDAKNVTVGNLVDTLKPDVIPGAIVTDIAVLPKTLALQAKSYVLNDVNIIASRSLVNSIFTIERLAGKNIGLRYYDTTQTVTRDKFQDVITELENVVKSDGYVKVSAISDGRLIIGGKSVVNIKPALDQHGYNFFRFLIEDDWSMARLPRRNYSNSTLFFNWYF